MSSSIPNEFVDSSDDNSLRPWTNGIKEHNDSLATIVLFTDYGASASLESDKKSDYINNLSKTVQTLISESVENISGGVPDVPMDEMSINGNVIPGGKIPVLKLDGINKYYGVFNNFSLLSFTEAHDQIVKVHMNFSASWNAFFFGKTPEIYQFKGYFIDTMDYPYYQEFMVAFDKYLSGRKAVENKVQTKLIIAGQIIDGYLLNVAVSHNANTTALKEFQFTMLAKGTSWIRSNIIYSSAFGGNIQYNGLSNINRLNKQLLNGSVEHGFSKDSSGKIVEFGITRSTK